MYSCRFCEKAFSTFKGLNGHQRIHNENHGCRGTRTADRAVNEVERVCETCSDLFVVYQSSPQRFCGAKCSVDHRWTLTARKIEAGECHERTTLSKYLTKRDGYACSACGIEDWQGQPLSLDVDHIDGDPKNNLPTNLRFLCPNCHRQTDSWGNSTAKRASKNGRGHAGIDMRKLKS